MYVITLLGTRKPYYLNRQKDLFTHNRKNAISFPNLAQAQDALQSILSWSPDACISEVIESEPEWSPDKITPLFDNPDFISDISQTEGQANGTKL